MIIQGIWSPGRGLMGAWYVILILQSVVTYALTGLSWCMQLVHYPLFSYVERDRFPDFLRKHQKRIALCVIPLMVVECFLALLTLVVAPAGIISILTYVLLGLVLVVWASMFCVHLKEQESLTDGFCQKSLKKFMTASWIRTGAWTCRTFLLLLLLSN